MKYLPDFHFEPVVLTSGKDDKMMRDDSLEKEIPSSVQIVRIEDPFDSFACLYTLDWRQTVFDYIFAVSDSEEWMKLFFNEQKKNLRHVLPDNRVFWEIECIRHIEEYVDMDGIDVIYTTAPAYSQLMLGCYFKLKYGIPWVADYRDLWTSDETYRELYLHGYTENDMKLQRPLEQVLVKHMDAIVLAGGFWADKFVSELHAPRERIWEITNGYDEADFKNISIRTAPNEKFTLCYNGRMHHSCRNPKLLLEILNQCIEEGKINPGKVCWIINGEISLEFQEIIRKRDTHHIIKANGLMDHLTSVQIAADSDLMVFYGEGGVNGALNYPGKFYEYLRIGRPILCFSGHNSFQEKVLKEIGLGENFDYDEMDLVKQYIVLQYRKWEEKVVCRPQYNKGIALFERKILTKKLVDVLEQIVGGEQ